MSTVIHEHVAPEEASSAQVDAGSPALPAKLKRIRRVREPKPKQYAVGDQETEQSA